MSKIKPIVKTLRRKLNLQQLSNILENMGEVYPLASEKGRLTFTSAMPRKSQFYIELDVPTVEFLPKERFNPLQRTNLSDRYRTTSDFRPNLFDEAVKVYRRTGRSGYSLIPKSELLSPDFANYGTVPKRIHTEKPIRLDSHNIYLPETPQPTQSGPSYYMEIFDPANPGAIDIPEYRVRDNAMRIGYRSGTYLDSDFNYKPLFGDTEGSNITTLKSKIQNQNSPSRTATLMVEPAKRFYMENYNVSPNALTDDEWQGLMQTILEKNSGKDILFHSTHTPFQTIDLTKLNHVNDGFYGRGLYFSDIPTNDYGHYILPFAFPKGKQLRLFDNNGFLHADNEAADKLLQSLRKPMVKWTKKGFKDDLWGPWPGMKETSKDPESWNQFLIDNDIDILKATKSSKGSGVVYPEILIPTKKTPMLEFLFKAPSELKQGGKL